jgi:Xaa-Pro dipeptidase
MSGGRGMIDWARGYARIGIYYDPISQADSTSTVVVWPGVMPVADARVCKQVNWDNTHPAWSRQAPVRASNLRQWRGSSKTNETCSVSLTSVKMTNGVGGSDQETALARLVPCASEVEEISAVEHQTRISQLQRNMTDAGVDAVYVNAGTNLLYFTGIEWHPSERLLGAIIPAKGSLIYIAPWFEERTLRDRMKVESDVMCWHEDESAYAAFYKALRAIGIAPVHGSHAKIAICGTASASVYFGLKELSENCELVCADALIGSLRKNKSRAEIALMQAAKDMTLQVHRAAASILREGISTVEVYDFIDRAHRKVGATGSHFCIVLFGEATSYPHGVKEPQVLKRNDVVLIDTGCKYKNYVSDITRTYVFGEANDRQRFVWNAEKAAQAAAFDAARLGVPCAEVDRAARRCLVFAAV